METLSANFSSNPIQVFILDYHNICIVYSDIGAIILAELQVYHPSILTKSPFTYRRPSSNQRHLPTVKESQLEKNWL